MRTLITYRTHATREKLTQWAENVALDKNDAYDWLIENGFDVDIVECVDEYN